MDVNKVKTPDFRKIAELIFSDLFGDVDGSNLVKPIWIDHFERSSKMFFWMGLTDGAGLALNELLDHPKLAEKLDKNLVQPFKKEYDRILEG